MNMVCLGDGGGVLRLGSHLFCQPFINIEEDVDAYGVVTAPYEHHFALFIANDNFAAVLLNCALCIVNCELLRFPPCGAGNYRYTLRPGFANILLSCRRGGELDRHVCAPERFTLKTFFRGINHSLPL